MSGITLLYIPSKQIVDFIARHPIKWDNKDRAKRGGVGDSAGVTPTPAVEEFMRLLVEKRQLFTQEEYMRHCWEQWREWILRKTREQKLGVKAKLYRNFYPSMIDSLHAWALLVESGHFDSCVLNSTEDAIGKTDLIVTRDGHEIRLALLGPKPSAMVDREYKLKYRNSKDSNLKCIEVVMPVEYPRSPGNKRWFQKHDLVKAIAAQLQER